MSRPPDADLPEDVMWQGKFVAAKRRGKWEYVTRVRGMRAAVILAIVENDVLLVEQYRVPLGRPCLELPAGLIGDQDADESVVSAAARELEEETGYRAGRIEELGEFFSSPGLVGESFTLVRAHDLARIHAGGGVDGENITVHRVALADVARFVAAKRDAGCAIDVKLLMLLGSTLI